MAGLTSPAITQQQLYRNVILRNCDTCHMAMDDTGTYAALESWATFTDGGLRLRAFMGLSGTANPETWHAGSFLMPHSQNLQARFSADTRGVDSTGMPVCQIDSQARPPVDCFLKALGTARPTQALPATMQALPHDPAAPDADCGQARKDLLSDGVAVTGYNSGRRVANGVCMSGCRRAQGTDIGVGCPGSEQIATFLSTGSFHGTREECLPLAGDPNGLGTCRPCGRLNQPACTQVVGTSCDVAYNPSCNRLPACHEGVVVDSDRGPLCAEQPLAGTAKQSSVSTTTTSMTSLTTTTATTEADKSTGPPGTGTAEMALDGSNMTFARTASGPDEWWTMDLGTSRHVTSIGFYNSTDPRGMADFVVQYAGANGWTTLPGGDFSQPATMGLVYTLIRLPEAVVTQSIRIQNIGGPYLEIADVDVKGW